jgi:hypothetical protein
MLFGVRIEFPPSDAGSGATPTAGLQILTRFVPNATLACTGPICARSRKPPTPTEPRAPNTLTLTLTRPASRDPRAATAARIFRQTVARACRVIRVLERPTSVGRSRAPDLQACVPSTKGPATDTEASGNMQPHPPAPLPKGEGSRSRKSGGNRLRLAPIRRHASFAAPPDFPGTCSAMHFHARGTAALVHVARQAGHACQVSPTASHRTFHRRLLLQGSPPCHRGGWRSSLPQASARPLPRRLADGSWCHLSAHLPAPLSLRERGWG